MLDQATRLREIALRVSDRSKDTGPYVCTITSGKGGVGKSMVALNLAIKLCESGSTVLLVDADGNLGNIDVLAGITPKLRLGHVLRGEKDIEDILVPLYPGLKVLPGSSGEADYPPLTDDHQARLMDDLTSLEERFDYLMIDTSAGLTRQIVGFAVRSQDAIIVTTPEPTAVMDAYAIIKMISQVDGGVGFKLIVNNARIPGEADETARKLQMAVDHFLRCSISYIGYIPYDKNVGKSVMRQNPVVKEFPSTGASLSLQVLAERFKHESRDSQIRRSVSQ